MENNIENQKKSSRILKVFFIISGFISLALGILGAVIPVLPTTPFMLLSAFLFSKSSNKFHQWLINHKIFGAIIRDYNKHKGIRMKYKVISVIMILISAIVSLITIPMLAIKILVISVLFVVAFILLTRFKTLA